MISHVVYFFLNLNMNQIEIINRDSEDFGKRLLFFKQSKKLCDAKIILNNKKIDVHAIVLASSCEYFSNEFINSESNKNEISFENINAEAFELLINYCYTGSIKVSENNAQEVLKIANQLIIKPIIESCSNILEKQLKSENCLKIWKFAESESLENLKLAAFEFTIKNFEEAVGSQEFLNLEYSDVNKLLESNINVTNEKIVYDFVKNWVNHDENSRIKHLNDLLNQVRLVYLPQEFLLAESQLLCTSNCKCYDLFIKALQWKLTKNVKKINSSLTTPRDSYITLITVGSENLPNTKIMELYDVNNEKWVKINDIIGDRIKFSSLLVEDKIMMFGGYSNNAPVNTVNVYDLKTGKLETLPSLKYSRYVPAVVLFQNIVYVIGGLGAQALFEVEKWDLETKSWSVGPSMKIPRIGHRARVLGDEIFVLGGLTHNDTYLNKTESYNPITNKWRTRAPMNEKRYAPGVAVLGGLIYAVCGWMALNVDSMSAERYDPKIDKWTMIQSTGIGRVWMEAGNLMGKLVIVGGYTNGAALTMLSNVEMYDEENDIWKSINGLNIPNAMSKVIEIPWGLAKLMMSRKTSK